MREFGDRRLFMDVADIQPGLDFREQIRESLDKCDVLLVVIGTAWLAATDDVGKRRLDLPTDSVRIEIATALSRNIPVIPVLIKGAKLPDQNLLPEDLQNLFYRGAVELTHVRWPSDVQVLAKALRRFGDISAPKTMALSSDMMEDGSGQKGPRPVYDELSNLRKELASLEIEEHSLLSLLKNAAKTERSWRGRTAADLIRAMDPLLVSYDSLNSAYWYLILYGVLRFKDINGGWAHESYGSSLKFAEIAPRGVALLNQIVREA